MRWRSVMCCVGSGWTICRCSPVRASFKLRVLPSMRRCVCVCAAAPTAMSPMIRHPPGVSSPIDCMGQPCGVCAAVARSLVSLLHFRAAAQSATSQDRSCKQTCVCGCGEQLVPHTLRRRAYETQGNPLFRSHAMRARPSFCCPWGMNII